MAQRVNPAQFRYWAITSPTRTNSGPLNRIRKTGKTWAGHSREHVDPGKLLLGQGLGSVVDRVNHVGY